MKKYNYFHFGQAITGKDFRANVPENWENELNEHDEYHYGGYKAILFDDGEKNSFDVYFNNETDSNNKGFEEDYAYCLDYIESNNGTDSSYFKDYKGGTVSIVNNETGETVYETEVL